MLRRNRFGFRLRRRSVTNRLLQLIVITSVFCLFVYFLIYAIYSNNDAPKPDFTWLKTRNMSHFVLPDSETGIMEPEKCSRPLRLLVIVHSAPDNVEKRRIIRKTWGNGIKAISPAVKVIFMMGVAKSEETQVKHQSINKTS